MGKLTVEDWALIAFTAALVLLILLGGAEGLHFIAGRI